MAAHPYVLARTIRAAHLFAREELGLAHGQYRLINHPSTVKSVRGADLYLVPGWQNRFDRFAMKGALRWTRMNVIDVAKLAQEPAGVPDGLSPAGEQLTIEDANAFLLALGTPDAEIKALVEENTSNGDNMTSEGGPVGDDSEVKRRRSRCKTCGTLHFKDEACPGEPFPGT